MRTSWAPIKDGLATGIAMAVAVTLICRLTGRGLGTCGGAVFLGGTVVAFLSAVWTIAGYHSPPGILGLWTGDVEVYPSARPESLWLDRFVNTRNVWLVAGLAMIAISFLPPFLRAGQ